LLRGFKSNLPHYRFKSLTDFFIKIVMIVPDEHKKYIDVKIPEDLIGIIDKEIIGKFGYKSRGEFVKEAVRKHLLYTLDLYKKLGITDS